MSRPEHHSDGWGADLNGPAGLADRARQLLSQIGRGNAASANDLVSLLQHADPVERVRAALVLGELGESGDTAAAALIAATADSEAQVREWAVWALAQLPRATAGVEAAIVAALLDTAAMVRKTAARVLAGAPPAAVHVPTVSGAALDVDPLVRRQVLVILGRCAHASEIAVRSVVRALDDDNGDVRAMAIAVLRRILEHSITELTEALTTGSARLRRASAQLLGGAGRAAIPALAAAARDDDELVRGSVLRSLASVAPDADQTAGTVIDAIRDVDAGVRAVAAEALGRMTGRMQTSVVVLGEALNDRDPGVRRAAALALGKLATIDSEALEPAIPHLGTAIDDDDAEVRCFVIWAIEKIGRPARALRPRLEAALEDEEPVVRRSAAWALERTR